MQPHELSVEPSLVGRWLIPVLLTILLGYTWFILLSDELYPLWQHWLALIGIMIVLFVNYRKDRPGILTTAVYLLLGIFCLFALLPSLTRSSIRIGPLPIPLGQLIAWPFLIVHVWINFNPLIDYYLDWKENKVQMKS